MAGWRTVFAASALAVAGVAAWATRLPETLRPEHRLELRFARVARAARAVVTHRVTMAYTFAMTALYAVFASYLASSEIIYTEVFGHGDLFPVFFGGLAAVMGATMLLNARVVRSVGTRRLAHRALRTYVAAAGVLVVAAVVTDGRPPLVLFLAAMAVILASHALSLPNCNTIALDPMGAIAGTASSVVGAVSMGGGALLGAMLDRAFDGTVLPISLGFLGYGVLSLALATWAETGHERGPAAAVGHPVAPGSRRGSGSVGG